MGYNKTAPPLLRFASLVFEASALWVSSRRESATGASQIAASPPPLPSFYCISYLGRDWSRQPPPPYPQLVASSPAQSAISVDSCSIGLSSVGLDACVRCSAWGDLSVPSKTAHARVPRDVDGRATTYVEVRAWRSKFPGLDVSGWFKVCSLDHVVVGVFFFRFLPTTGLRRCTEGRVGAAPARSHCRPSRAFDGTNLTSDPPSASTP